MASEVLGRFGRVDILVNNAGIFTQSLLADMSVADWDRVVGVNLRGTFLCTRMLIGQMLARGSGHQHRLSARPDRRRRGGHYRASKAGVIGLTKALAREVSACGVLVNAIAPGPILTPLLDGETEEWRSAKLAELPMGRFGTVAEVTPTAVLLGIGGRRLLRGPDPGAERRGRDALGRLGPPGCGRTKMNNREVLAAVRQSGVKLIRFEYCDVSGVARAKAVHVAQLAHKLVEGVGLTRAQMSINLLEQLIHIDGMEPVGEVRLVPDPATFTVLPWAPASASVLCDQLDHDRRNWGACTRSYLKDMIARAAAAGISVQATFENEYYLAREEDGRFVPVDAPCHAPVYSAIGHDVDTALMVQTVDALEVQGMAVEQAINEFGPGQREIAIRHTDALRAADNQMKFRDTVRGVAWQHGLLASFAPKPYPDEIGSGAHVHFSLWDSDGERNLLYDPPALTAGCRRSAGISSRGSRITCPRSRR